MKIDIGTIQDMLRPCSLSGFVEELVTNGTEWGYHFSGVYDANEIKAILADIEQANKALKGRNCIDVYSEWMRSVADHNDAEVMRQVQAYGSARQWVEDQG